MEALNFRKLEASEYQFFWKFAVWQFHEVLVKFEKVCEYPG